MPSMQIVHELAEKLQKREITAATTFQSSRKVRNILFFLFFFAYERNSSQRPRCIKSTFEIVNTSRVFCFLDESSGWRLLETEPTRWKCRLTLGILVRLQGKVHVSGASGQSRLFSRSVVAGDRGEVATHVHHS